MTDRAVLEALHDLGPSTSRSVAAYLCERNPVARDWTAPTVLAGYGVAGTLSRLKRQGRVRLSGEIWSVASSA